LAALLASRFARAARSSMEIGERATSTQLIAGDSDCQHGNESALSGISVNANKDSHARGSGLCAGFLLRQRTPASERQPLAIYSAGRDIAVESEPSTGTKFDIAANDQIKPIATTTATIHASICIPSTSR
jgi:hypothetical protein